LLYDTGLVLLITYLAVVCDRKHNSSVVVQSFGLLEEPIIFLIFAVELLSSGFIIEVVT
jgi:hypothetical protein